MHCLQRPLHSVKCTAWVAISKHGIIGPFWFEVDNERSWEINTERYVQALGKFWTALGWRRGVVRVFQWFQRGGATSILQMNHWHGYSSVSLTEWSAAGVTRSGGCIHRTWFPQIFICGDTLRTGCMETTPRLSLTWRQQSVLPDGCYLNLLNRVTKKCEILLKKHVTMFQLKPA